MGFSSIPEPLQGESGKLESGVGESTGRSVSRDVAIPSFGDLASPFSLSFPGDCEAEGPLRV